MPYRSPHDGQTPVYTEPPEQYAAEFVRRDAATRGNWGGVYGKDGYVLCNYHGDGKDERSLPAYVTSVDYYRAFPAERPAGCDDVEKRYVRPRGPVA